MRNLLAIVLVYVLVPLLSAVAQPGIDRHRFLLSNLGTEDGLSSARIYSVLQGADGVMWFGSKSGVSRYNGNRIRNYRLSQNERYSDASGRIVKLMNGGRGKIYAYDNKGYVFEYNPVFDSFMPVASLKRDISESVILNDARCMYGDMLCALDRGVYVISPGRKPRWLIRGVFVNHVNSLGSQVLMAADRGVYVGSLSTGRSRLVIKGLSVQSSYYDMKTGRLWLGTFHEGVKVYDVRTWHEIPMSGLSQVPHTPVRTIEPLDARTMLFGIDGAGIYAARRDGSAAWLLFNADDETGSALHGNGVYDICVDSDGDVWMGSYSGGVDLAVPVSYMMEIVQHEFLNTQSLINNSVNDVLEAPDGTICYATDRGVSIYDTNLHTWRHVLQGKVVLSLSLDGHGAVLAGTYGDGVFAVPRAGSVRQAYSMTGGELKTDYVYSVFTDRDGDLWIGCLDGDLVHITPSGRNYYPVRQVQTIAGMPDGRVAVGTSDGFYAIDKRTRKYTWHFRSNEFGDRDFNTYLQAMLFTGRNEVWLATDGGGLCQYNLRTHHVSQLTTADGLPSNTVYALGMDSRGRILASTDLGLALVMRGRGKPQVININFVKGLEREYKRMSIAPMLDGRFIFGSSSGAVIIDPRHIDRLNYQAPLHLRGITVTGLEEEKREEWQQRLYGMIREGKVRLPYDRNTFMLQFESINYKYQHDILYQYRLEGFDKDWSRAGTGQGAGYTNLPPGSYHFVVRSISRNDGHILGQQALDIQVRQPWWNTVWAWLVYLALTGVLVYFGWQFYRNRLQQRYFDEKINFFVNTAHDIRTPLSLILAPLNDIAEDTKLSERSRSYLDIARSNGGKLLNMITQLLDFQKADLADRLLTLRLFDLRNVLTVQIDKFRPLAEQKEIDLRLIRCPEKEGVMLDAGMADKIFENILSNAVKYTPMGGKVLVEAWADHRHLYIKVEDTGIGIPKDAQKHIFQNFYRAENAVNSQETGSGLGLMLTRRLVERHHGRLSFESVEGKGTSFLIALPKAPGSLSRTPATAAVSPHPSLVSSVSAVPEVRAGEEKQDTLLFVDDNDELRHYIRMTFSDRYNVVDVASAEAALDYLQNELCDIIVSDVMMPGMTGDELCRRVKENVETSWLPVILLTAKSGRDFMIEGLGLGADDYITKPFDTAVLRGKIDSMLQNRRRLSRYYLGRSVELVRGNEEPVPSVTEAQENQPDAVPTQETLSAEDRSFIDKATRIVMDNLSDTDFNIDSLCREMAMSRTLFYGRLKTLTAQTPQDFIRLIRLERAAVLIRQGKSIADVAMLTGFVNSKYFSTLFKKHFGVSPSKY